MINTVIHKASSRGHVDHGWINSHHTFSFASYYDPERMHFGVLRVLNDDTVAASMGFGAHRHDNMEIITIPLEGDLEHKDSMGNSTLIKYGDVQMMSAGTGIQHSEYNHNKETVVKFLQIWIFPNKKNVRPRYDQISLNLNDRYNKWQQIISPNPEDEGLWIYQDSWFHMGRFDKDFTTKYHLKNDKNGVYIFVIKGNISINDELLDERDGYGVWNLKEFNIHSNIQDSEVLLMEVPMEIK